MIGFVQTSVVALELASGTGVPFVGAAAVLVREISAGCEDVKLYRTKSKRMAKSCAVLLNSLCDQSSALEGSALQEYVDQVTLVLERIRSRMNKWSKVGRLRCYLGRAELLRELEDCENDLKNTMDAFQLSAHIIGNALARENQEAIVKENAETRELLLRILASKDDMRRIVEMHGDGERVAEGIMEAGQKELQYFRNITEQPGTRSTSQQRDAQRRLEECQRGLLTLHQKTGIAPSVKILDGEVMKLGELPIAGGSDSDIWLGQWLGEEKVALKSLRNIKASHPRARKRFEHELNVWAELKDDNILPFYGIVTTLGNHIHMVSPWQEYGNVLAYTKGHPESNKLNLIKGAAKGLKFLHANQIIHGNVKCTNILVSVKGESCICDFGMSKVIADITDTTASATLTAQSGNTRWLAPELINGTVTSPTKATDVYSFGMACLELLTGKKPWSQKRQDASVIHAIVVLKETPPKPVAIPGLSDELWLLMENCWSWEAPNRPSMDEIVERLVVQYNTS
ncbi:TKL/TKL-ccin protein kinase [Mycena floridula]|nr:TKL/TKL-ccin protein kinase [Mycena floridula]